MLLLAQLANTLQQVSLSSDDCGDENRRIISRRDVRMAHPSGCLHVAIIAGRTKTLQQLLESGHDPNDMFNGKTALVTCLSLHNSEENLERIKLLIKYGANVNLCNPLHMACQRGLLPVIDILINNGASTERLEQTNGFTPLQSTLHAMQTASQRQKPVLAESVLTLLKHPHVDVTNCGLYGPSPLNMAVLTSHPGIIRAVISSAGTQLETHEVQMALELITDSFIGPSEDLQQITDQLLRLKHNLHKSCDVTKSEQALSLTSAPGRRRKSFTKHNQLSLGANVNDFLSLF